MVVVILINRPTGHSRYDVDADFDQSGDHLVHDGNNNEHDSGDDVDRQAHKERNR